MVKIDFLICEVVGVFFEVVCWMFLISGVMLFGSCVCCDNLVDSDVDFVVFLKGDVGFFVLMKFVMVDIVYDIFFEKGVLIQFLFIWEQEWQYFECYFNLCFLVNICCDGIVL